MTACYVIDSYAVMALGEILTDGETRQRVLDELSECVQAGRLTFPDAVLSECRQYARGEPVTIWIVAVAGSRPRHLSTFPGSKPMEVLGKIPGLHAAEDAGMQTHIEVACLAAARVADGMAITVITEDMGLGGVRLTLAEACGELAIPTCGLTDYLDALGLADVLN